MYKSNTCFAFEVSAGLRNLSIRSLEPQACIPFRGQNVVILQIFNARKSFKEIKEIVNIFEEAPPCDTRKTAEDKKDKNISSFEALRSKDFIEFNEFKSCLLRTRVLLFFPALLGGDSMAALKS